MGDHDDEVFGEEEDLDDYSWPRDVAIDTTKRKLVEFFAENLRNVYYDQQLRVLFEEKPYKVFQWITGKALTELRESRELRSELVDLRSGRPRSVEMLGPGAATVVRFFWHPRNRYTRRRINRILELVRQFSTPEFGRGLGHQGEVLADLALLNLGFAIKGKKVRSWKGKSWERSSHDLDRVYERDGIFYGCEIKNTLGYIPKDELTIKVEMCKHLGLRPMVIARSLPAHYLNTLYEAGGFGWIVGRWAWPFGHEKLAEEVRAELGFRVSCAAAIEEGAVERMVRAHKGVVRRARARKSSRGSV